MIKCQFEEKLCNQLIDHSYFHFMGEEISQEKTVDEAGIKNNDEIWVFSFISFKNYL